MKQVFLYDKKSNSFCDKTSQVSSCFYEPSSRRWRVTFAGGNTSYSYDDEHIRVIDTDGVCLDDGGRTVMKPVNSSRSKMILQYLILFCSHQEELAQRLKDHPQPSEEDGESIENAEVTCPYRSVGRHLGKVDVNNGVLRYFLHGILPDMVQAEDPAMIFPFGCNSSQHKAVSRALSNPLSVIEGPPGTGKTQTILNLIANLLIRGKSIAVVSNNNSAVENVFEKMDAHGLGMLVARLGNQNKVKSFFAQGLQAATFPESWALETQVLHEKQRLLADLSLKASRLFEKQVRRERLRSSLAEIEHERSVFVTQHSCVDQLDIASSLFEGWSESRLDSFERSFVHMANARGIKALLLRSLFKLRNYRKSTSYLLNRDLILLAVQLARYDAIAGRLRSEIEALRETSASNTFLKLYRDCSMAILRDHVARNFGGLDAPKVTDEDYKASGAFWQRFPVVTSSTYSLASCSGRTFDYVIVDEASQVNLPTGALCMSRANRMVVVGDRRQLPHIVDEASLHPCEGVPSSYDAVDESLLSSVLKTYEDGRAKVPCTLLAEHYRCHPLIIGYCNKRFYNDQMVVMTQSPVKFPFRIIDVPTGPLSHDLLGRPVNVRPLEESRNVVESCEAHGMAPAEIGAISPYRGHANALGQALSPVEADTVHRFQGREKDVVIYNSVRNNVTKFNDDPHLLNVAVSRAKNEFVLIAPKDAVLADVDSNLAALIRYVDYNDPEQKFTRHSSYSSVFDKLYETAVDYGQNAGESPAEALFRHLLDDVIGQLNSGQTPASLAYVQEYRLILLTRRRDVFSPEEWRYMSNGSRLDFLVYDIMGHEPRLAVEVDGSTHDTSDGRRRDALKNSILEKMNIPILRFRTNSIYGGEREALMNALRH